MGTTTRIFLGLALSVVACGGGGGGGGTGDETTTTSPSDTSSESTSSTTVTPTTTQSPESTETGNGPPCPFYGFEALPMGNVGTAYEFIPDPSDEPFWVPTYVGDVPGLSLGETITGVPEAEGRFMVMQMLASEDGGQCQVEMTTLVIGPPLPGDSTGTETGTETGTDSSGGSDSSSDDGSSSGSTTGE